MRHRVLLPACPPPPAPTVTRAPTRIGSNFVANQYLEMKKANPKLPILVREAQAATPRVVARFGTPLPSASIIVVP